MDRFNFNVETPIFKNAPVKHLTFLGLIKRTQPPSHEKQMIK